MGRSAHRRAVERASSTAIHWYSLYDLAARLAGHDAASRGGRLVLITATSTWGCCERTERRSWPTSNFTSTRPKMGICQWFHFEDHRLDDAVRHLQDLGVRYLRTGLSWADYYRDNALDWFDRQMKALEPFDVTVTYCFTPEHKGVQPHYTVAAEGRERIRRVLRGDDAPLRVVIVYADREEVVDTGAFRKRIEQASDATERLILQGQFESGVDGCALS